MFTITIDTYTVTIDTYTVTIFVDTYRAIMHNLQVAFVLASEEEPGLWGREEGVGNSTGFERNPPPRFRQLV